MPLNPVIGVIVAEPVFPVLPRSPLQHRPGILIAQRPECVAELLEGRRKRARIQG